MLGTQHNNTEIHILTIASQLDMQNNPEIHILSTSSELGTQ